MWWYGRENSGGSWLPEEKKANMWYGRGNSGGSWPPAFPRSLCRVKKVDVSSTFIENIFPSGMTLVSSNDIITIKIFSYIFIYGLLYNQTVEYI